MLLVSTSLLSQSQNSNPIYNSFNEAINFAAIDADDIVDATKSVQNESDESINKIVQIADDQRTFENTLVAIDDLSANLSDVYNVIYLLSSTHTDSLIRNSALEARVTLGQYWNQISLNEDLYKAAKNYSESEAAKSLKGYKAKFVKELIEEYERNGFALSPEKRNELKVINDEL